MVVPLYYSMNKSGFFVFNIYDMKYLKPFNEGALAGFSDKVFQVMEFLEKDKNALLNEIKGIEI